MAIEKYIPEERIEYFTHFFTGNDSQLIESFSPSFEYELNKVRLRLSTSHVSDVHFMVTLSHHLGSQYDQNILSQSMNAVRDVWLALDPGLKLNFDDTLRFSLILSASNTWGLEVGGWAITVR